MRRESITQQVEIYYIDTLAVPLQRNNLASASAINLDGDIRTFLAALQAWEVRWKTFHGMLPMFLSPALTITCRDLLERITTS